MIQNLLALLRGPVARGASWSFALQVGHAGLTFLTALILARALGPAEFGAYAFAVAWAGLLAAPASLGFGPYLVRRVAILQQAEHWGELRGLLRVAVATVVLASSAIAFATWLTAREGWLPIDPIMAAALSVGAWLIPISAALLALEGVLRGFHRIALAYLPDRLIRPAAFLAAAVGAHYVLGAPLAGASAVALYLAASGLALAAAGALLRRARPPETTRVPASYATRRWVSDALPFVMLAAVQMLQTQTDVVMLGLLAEPEETGVYRAVSRTAGLMAFGLMAVNAALAPRLAARHAAGQSALLQRNVTQAALAATAFALPIAVVFLLAGREILGLFGEEFRAGETALWILTVGYLINAAAGPNALVLSMTGHAHIAARGLALGVGANVALSAALIPPFGVEGAAIAMTAAMIVWNATLASSLWRNLEINSTVFGWRWKPRKAASP